MDGERGLPPLQVQNYNFAFLDEGAKREIRRATLKAVAIPGYQVPFASRELPIARGWGTGGLQITLSLIGPDDCLKVIDQGADDSVNAVSIRRLVEQTAGIATTEDTAEATVIQTRHRVPEDPLHERQILVLQVPEPEPLRRIEPSEGRTRRMHAEKDYSAMWLHLYEDIIRWGSVAIGADYPAVVHGRHLMNPSPIPRHDLPRFHQSSFLSLFGAGREKKIYAVPPYTDVTPLAFEDYPFEVESFAGKRCALCGSETAFLDEWPGDPGTAPLYRCSDTAHCLKRQRAAGAETARD